MNCPVNDLSIKKQRKFTVNSLMLLYDNILLISYSLEPNSG